MVLPVKLYFITVMFVYSFHEGVYIKSRLYSIFRNRCRHSCQNNLFNCIVTSGRSFSPNKTDMQCYLNLQPTFHVRFNFNVTFHSRHSMLDPMIAKNDIGKFPCIHPDFLPTSPYVCPCPNTLPTNGKDFLHGRPTRPPFRWSAMGVLYFLAILPATPTPHHPPCRGPIYSSPLPLPRSSEISFDSGYVAPVTQVSSSAQRLPHLRGAGP